MYCTFIMQDWPPIWHDMTNMTNNHDMYISNGIIHGLIFPSFNLIYSHLYKVHKYTCTYTHLVQLQLSAIISQYRPRVLFKYSFWQPEECFRPKRQAIMYACIPAGKFPRKYSRQRDVTIITSVVPRGHR